MNRVNRLNMRDTGFAVLLISSALALSDTAMAADWPPSPETAVLIMDVADTELSGAFVEGSSSEPGLNPIDDLDDAIADDATNADALNQRGLYRLELGDRDGALADFGAAIVADPTDIDPRYNLGLGYELKGQFAAAQDIYQKVWQMRPESEAGIAAWWGLEAIRHKPLLGQASVLDRFGAPDAFIVTVAAPNPNSSELSRVEVWQYLRDGKEFTFVNAELQKTADLPKSDRQSAYPLYRPYQFESGMAFLNAARSAGFEDYGYITYANPGLEDVHLVIANQIMLGFLSERLFFVQTVPYALGPFAAPPAEPAIVEQPETPPAATVPVAAPPGNEFEARLTKLKQLFDRGLITEEEYRAKRQDILDQL